VFGIDFQKPNWEVCILVEGIFDALSINACALTHNTINDDQVELLSQLNRKIIFVPDHDKTGLETIDRALELGYSISIPDWDRGVKDVNDAVIKYGKLTTLLSILQSATTSKVKIEMQRRKLDKRI
jgi:DNA primase